MKILFSTTLILFLSFIAFGQKPMAKPTPTTTIVETTTFEDGFIAAHTVVITKINGDKVTGLFMGGTYDSITINISGSTVHIKIPEIKLIDFSDPQTASGQSAVSNDEILFDTQKLLSATADVSENKIGIPKCDEYIEKIEACLNEKIPEAQRAMFKSSIDAMRRSWKEAAASPEGRTALAGGCKTALKTAKQSYTAYGCKW